MKIFLSWSGSRSKAVAEAFRDWLPQVIQSIEPWISTDMGKGIRSHAEISTQLENTRVGVICLTEDNLTPPWILFESGAISKTKDAHVCTFLLDIKPAAVAPPLGLFQSTTFQKRDVYQLLETINTITRASLDRALPDAQLESTFEVWWPQLEDRLRQIAASPPDKPAASERPDRVLLEELLEMVRNLQRPVVESTALEPAPNAIEVNHYQITFPNSSEWSTRLRQGMALNFVKPVKNLISANTTVPCEDLCINIFTNGGALRQLKEIVKRIAPDSRLKKIGKSYELDHKVPVTENFLKNQS